MLVWTAFRSVLVLLCVSAVLIGFGRAQLREAEQACNCLAVCGGVGQTESRHAPEVYRLGADGRGPELGEAGGLSACGRRMAAGIVLAEVCAESAEDAGAGAERHGGLAVGASL